MAFRRRIPARFDSDIHDWFPLQLLTAEASSNPNTGERKLSGFFLSPWMAGTPEMQEHFRRVPRSLAVP
jgi:hypothetical protein